MNTSIQYATRLKGYWDFCAHQQVRCEKQGNFMYLSIWFYYDFSRVLYQIMAPTYSHFKEDFKKEKKNPESFKHELLK